MPVTEGGGGNQYLEGGNKSQQRAIAGARVATRSEVIGNRWEAPGRVEDDGFPGVRRLRGIRLRGIPRGAVAGRTLWAEGTVGRRVRAIRGPSERFGRVGMSCVTLTQTMRCPSDDATIPRFFSTAQLFVRNRVWTLVKICAWCMVEAGLKVGPFRGNADSCSQRHKKMVLNVRRGTGLVIKPKRSPKSFTLAEGLNRTWKPIPFRS